MISLGQICLLVHNLSNFICWIIFFSIAPAHFPVFTKFYGIHQNFTQSWNIRIFPGIFQLCLQYFAEIQHLKIDVVPCCFTFLMLFAHGAAKIGCRYCILYINIFYLHVLSTWHCKNCNIFYDYENTSEKFILYIWVFILED